MLLTTISRTSYCVACAWERKRRRLGGPRMIDEVKKKAAKENIMKRTQSKVVIARWTPQFKVYTWIICLKTLDGRARHQHIPSYTPCFQFHFPHSTLCKCVRTNFSFCGRHHRRRRFIHFRSYCPYLSFKFLWMLQNARARTHTFKIGFINQSRTFFSSSPVSSHLLC